MSKTYLVTNNSEGSICVTGRIRIDIPGKCQDMRLVLPDYSAKQTVARLKQRYPLLKIREALVEARAAAKPAKANPVNDEAEKQNQLALANANAEAQNDAAQKQKSDNKKGKQA